MRITSGIFTIAAAAALALGATGCGPGFPIMTGEQENLIANVDMVMKENETLRKRVESLSNRIESLEAGGSAELGGVKEELDSLKFSIAETNTEVEKIRREFSFVQGSVEEADHARGQFSEDMRYVGDSLKLLDERLASVENSNQVQDVSIADLTGKVEDERIRGEAMAEKMNSIDQRLSSVDARIAEVQAAAQKAPVKAAAPEKEDPEALYHKGYQLTQEKDYAAAAEVFERMIRYYPAHKFAGNAQYWLAEIHYSRGEWEKAILEFDKVIKEYPKSDKVPAALLKQGFSFLKLDSTEEAKVLLDQVIEKFPESREASLAKQKLETVK